jgi:hypothetical protein
VDLPHLLLHVLGWLWPGWGLSVLVLVFWAVRRPARPPRLGWWGAALLLMAAAPMTQAVTLWGLRWPDGSMSSYAALVLVLATLRVFLTRSDSRLS